MLILRTTKWEMIKAIDARIKAVFWPRSGVNKPFQPQCSAVGSATESSHPTSSKNAGESKICSCFLRKRRLGKALISYCRIGEEKV